MSMDGVAVAIVLCCVVVVLMDCCCCCRDLCAEQKKRCRCQSAERITCVGKVGSIGRKKEFLSLMCFSWFVWLIGCMNVCTSQSQHSNRWMDERKVRGKKKPRDASLAKFRCKPNVCFAGGVKMRVVKSPVS